jgi:hypothetical protein
LQESKRRIGSISNRNFISDVNENENKNLKLKLLKRSQTNESSVESKTINRIWITEHDLISRKIAKYYQLTLHSNSISSKTKNMKSLRNLDIKPCVGIITKCALRNIIDTTDNIEELFNVVYEDGYVEVLNREEVQEGLRLYYDLFETELKKNIKNNIQNMNIYNNFQNRTENINEKNINLNHNLNHKIKNELKNIVNSEIMVKSQKSDQYETKIDKNLET